MREDRHSGRRTGFKDWMEEGISEGTGIVFLSILSNG